MSTSDHSHRGDQQLVDHADLDPVAPQLAPVAPIVTNAEAERAARAQRQAAEGQAPELVEQKKFLGDGDGADPPSAPPPQRDDDSTNYDPVVSWGVLRGPPRPRATEQLDDVPWVGAGRFEAHSLDEQPFDGASWESSADRDGNATLPDGTNTWLAR